MTTPLDFSLSLPQFRAALAAQTLDHEAVNATLARLAESVAAYKQCVKGSRSMQLAREGAREAVVSGILYGPPGTFARLAESVAAHQACVARSRSQQLARAGAAGSARLTS